MKKWMIAAVVGIIVITAALYVLIPGTIHNHSSVVINISQTAISRLLIENSNWNKGWPGEDTAAGTKDNGQSVSFNGNTYSIVDRKYSSIILSIHRGNDIIATSSLNIIPISKSSVQLDWEALVPASNNPVKRLQQYLGAGKIKNDMGILLNKMEAFYSRPTNVYGIDIRRESVVDSTLLFTYDSIKGYPSVEFIYSLINNLKNYTNSQHATVTGYPMLNINTKDSVVYLVKVALPVDKKLPSVGKIAYKWMLPGGNILVTDVKGGGTAIANALKQMDYFMDDYGRQAPAIPFLSLVTDRMKEKDSTKWITRIYYPVMDL